MDSGGEAGSQGPIGAADGDESRAPDGGGASQELPSDDAFPPGATDDVRDWGGDDFDDGGGGGDDAGAAYRACCLTVPTSQFWVCNDMAAGSWVPIQKVCFQTGSPVRMQ